MTLGISLPSLRKELSGSRATKEGPGSMTWSLPVSFFFVQLRAPEPWRVPLPGKSNAREFIPTQQDFNLDLLRASCSDCMNLYAIVHIQFASQFPSHQAMRDMQSPQNHPNRQTGFGEPQDRATMQRKSNRGFTKIRDPLIAPKQ